MSVFISWNNRDFLLTYFLSVLILNEDSSRTCYRFSHPHKYKKEAFKYVVR